MSSFFDRPAFKGPAHFKSARSEFEKAIHDVILAINTGSIAHQPDQGRPRNALKNREWRATMRDVEIRLSRALRATRNWLAVGPAYDPNSERGRAYEIPWSGLSMVIYVAVGGVFAWSLYRMQRGVLE